MTRWAVAISAMSPPSAGTTQLAGRVMHAATASCSGWSVWGSKAMNRTGAARSTETLSRALAAARICSSSSDWRCHFTGRSPPRLRGRRLTTTASPPSSGGGCEPNARSAVTTAASRWSVSAPRDVSSRTTIASARPSATRNSGPLMRLDIGSAPSPMPSTGVRRSRARTAR